MLRHATVAYCGGPKQRAITPRQACVSFLGAGPWVQRTVIWGSFGWGRRKGGEPRDPSAECKGEITGQWPRALRSGGGGGSPGVRAWSPHPRALSLPRHRVHGRHQDVRDHHGSPVGRQPQLPAPLESHLNRSAAILSSGRDGSDAWPRPRLRGGASAT